MVLEWRPPRKDGGAPVEKYIIEKKSKHSPTWEKAAEVPGDATKGVAPNLTEGEEYEFRVVAVNKAGPGEPSDPSKSVVAKPRHRKQKLSSSLTKTQEKNCLKLASWILILRKRLCKFLQLHRLWTKPL